SGGYTYQQLIFNAHIGGQVGASGPGTITVVSAEPGGAANQTFSFTVPSGGFGNGENFFTVAASGGESIISTAFSATNTVTDIRQVRLSGFTAPTQQEAPGVPEPTTIVLLSSALVGIGLIRKR